MSKTPSPADEVKRTIDEQVARIRKALEDRRVGKVAEATGLHRNTVRNIMRGKGGAPSMETLDRLGKYLFA